MSNLIRLTTALVLLAGTPVLAGAPFETYGERKESLRRLRLARYERDGVRSLADICSARALNDLLHDLVGRTSGESHPLAGYAIRGVRIRYPRGSGFHLCEPDTAQDVVWLGRLACPEYAPLRAAVEEARRRRPTDGRQPLCEALDELRTEYVALHPHAVRCRSIDVHREFTRGLRQLDGLRDDTGIVSGSGLCYDGDADETVETFTAFLHVRGLEFAPAEDDEDERANIAMFVALQSCWAERFSRENDTILAERRSDREAEERRLRGLRQQRYLDFEQRRMQRAAEERRRRERFEEGFLLAQRATIAANARAWQWAGWSTPWSWPRNAETRGVHVTSSFSTRLVPSVRTTHVPSSSTTVRTIRVR